MVHNKNKSKKRFKNNIRRNGAVYERCQAFKSNSNKQCGAIALKDKGYCRVHSGAFGRSKPNRKVKSSPKSNNNAIYKGIQEKISSRENMYVDLLKTREDLELQFVNIVNYIDSCDKENIPVKKYAPVLTNMLSRYRKTKSMIHKMETDKSVSFDIHFIEGGTTPKKRT